MSKQQLGVLFILIATISLSIEGIAAKLAYQGGTSVMTVLFFRYLFATLLFWLGVPLLKECFLLPRKKAFKLIVFSLFTQGGTVLCLFYSFMYIPAALTILILYIYPTLVTFLAYLFLKEPLTKYKYISLALTLIGITIILGQPVENLDYRGVIFALVAAIINSLYVIIGANLVKTTSVWILNTYAATTLLGLFSIIGFFSNTLTWHMNTTTWLSVLVLAFICTGVATFSFFKGVSYIGASRASIICTSEPLFTAVLAFSLLGETLTINQILGGFIVIVGVLILEKFQTPEKTN